MVRPCRRSQHPTLVLAKDAVRPSAGRHLVQGKINSVCFVLLSFGAY